MDERQPHFENEPPIVTDTQLRSFIESTDVFSDDQTPLVMAVISAEPDKRQKLLEIYLNSQNQENLTPEIIELEQFRKDVLYILQNYLEQILPTLNLKPDIIARIHTHSDLIAEFSDVATELVKVYSLHHKRAYDQVARSHAITGLKRVLNKMRFR